MKTPELIRYRISTDDYHLMIKAGILTEQDKVELIRGEIVKMSPKGSKHAACIRKILSWLPQQLTADLQLQVQDPISVLDDSEPEPDLAVVRANQDFYADAHPQARDVHLLIEVADSSLGIDRTTKAGIYAEAGISHYWIVNLVDQVIEMHQSPHGQRYKEIRIAEPGDRISLPNLQIETAVEDWLI